MFLWQFFLFPTPPAGVLTLVTQPSGVTVGVPHASDTPRQCHQPIASQPPVPCHPAPPPMRALFSVTPQLSCVLPAPSHPPTASSPLRNLMSGVKRVSCGWIISSPVVTRPQELVGQRPRHSYSLSPDARPQIQMSSINLFLQGEAGNATGTRLAWSAMDHLIQLRTHY